MEEETTVTRRTRGPIRCGLCRQVGHDRRHCTSSVADTSQQADADEISVEILPTTNSMPAREKLVTVGSHLKCPTSSTNKRTKSMSASAS